MRHRVRRKYGLIPAEILNIVLLSSLSGLVLKGFAASRL